MRFGDLVAAVLAAPVLAAVALVAFGFDFGGEFIYLIVGMAVAFVVSVIAIKFLMSYIKKHDFQVFGWYRIVLGILVIALGFCGVITV